MQRAIENLIELARAGGAVLASDWTSGTFKRHISRRAIPAGARLIVLPSVPPPCGAVSRKIAELVAKHPRARKIVALDPGPQADAMIEMARSL